MRSVVYNDLARRIHLINTFARDLGRRALRRKKILKSQLDGCLIQQI